MSRHVYSAQPPLISYSAFRSSSVWYSVRHSFGGRIGPILKLIIRCIASQYICLFLTHWLTNKLASDFDVIRTPIECYTSIDPLVFTALQLNQGNLLFALNFLNSNDYLIIKIKTGKRKMINFLPWYSNSKTAFEYEIRPECETFTLRSSISSL